MSLQLPDTMTPAMADALSTMLWTSGTLAQCFRAAGHGIKRRAEDEQAFVLFWSLKLAIEHGDGWRKVAADQIEAMAASVGQPVGPARASSTSEDRKP